MMMHENQLPVTADIVRELVESQFPEWVSLSITPVHSEGTVNAIFRIGERLAARFPLQPGEVEATRRALHSEAGAARGLLGRTRFPIPEPVGIGEPGAGYPLPWAVQTWLPGTTASVNDPSHSVAFARDLAEFICEVRAIPVNRRTFTGEGRGGDLRSHDQWMEVCFSRSERYVDTERLRGVWARLRALTREAPDTMTHGDLVPGNVLVADGRLAGILDVGGLGAADPALDLVAAWHLLDRGPRQRLRKDLECGDLEWERGKAWALQQAMGAVWYYVESNPAMSRMGRRTLDRIMRDEV
jgi:aminoglycoside phosphotransferase (APT) family kinase protein